MKTVAAIANKLLNLLIAVLAVFFLIMGVTDIGHDPFGVELGFIVGAVLTALYVWRKVKARRKAKAEAEAAASAAEKGAARRPVARGSAGLRICPHCGAPGKGEFCEYCGMPLD